MLSGARSTNADNFWSGAPTATFNPWSLLTISDCQTFWVSTSHLSITVSPNEACLYWRKGHYPPSPTLDTDTLQPTESIAAVRFEAAEKILQKLSAVHRNLATANGRHCREPSAAARQECRLDCENALLGSTIKALDANGLWPLPQAPALTYSLDTLVQKVAATAHMIRPLSSRDTNRSGGGGGGSGIRHVECNPAVELEDYARKILASAPSPVQHMHLAHMENQAKKSGLWFEEKEQ